MDASSTDLKARPTEAFIHSLQQRFPTEARIERCLGRKLRARPLPPYRPPNLDQIALRLQDFLRRRVSGETLRLGPVTPLAGGSSKQQFQFEAAYQDQAGVPHQEHLVLSLSPPEGTVQSDRLREFQAVRALPETLPLARPLWVDADGEEFGQPALIARYVSGVTRPPASTTAASSLTGAFAAHYRETLAPQFVDALAAIATAPLAGELTAFDRPQPGSPAGVLSAINWWQRVWEEDAIEPEPVLTLAAQWLRRNAPPIDHVSMVHGDYRTGNFLFDPESCAITAILDWEMCRLGDRHEDLAYVLSPLFTANDEVGRALVCGLLKRDAFLDRYAEKSGLPIDPQRLRYYALLNSYRQVVICLGTAARCLVSRSSHQDITVGMVSVVAPMLKRFLLQQLREVL